MAITTGTHPKLLWPGLWDIWHEGMYESFPNLWEPVFQSENSNMHFEEIKGVTSFGLARPVIDGARVAGSIDRLVRKSTQVEPIARLWPRGARRTPDSERRQAAPSPVAQLARLGGRRSGRAATLFCAAGDQVARLLAPGVEERRAVADQEVVEVKVGQAGKRHGMIKRTTKFIRSARGTMVLAGPDERIVKIYMPYNR